MISIRLAYNLIFKFQKQRLANHPFDNIRRRRRNGLNAEWWSNNGVIWFSNGNYFPVNFCPYYKIKGNQNGIRQIKLLTEEGLQLDNKMTTARLRSLWCVEYKRNIKIEYLCLDRADISRLFTGCTVYAHDLISTLLPTPFRIYFVSVKASSDQGGVIVICVQHF